VKGWSEVKESGRTQWSGGGVKKRKYRWKAAGRWAQSVELGCDTNGPAAVYSGCVNISTGCKKYAPAARKA